MAPSHRRLALLVSCAMLLALAIAETRAEDAKSPRRVLLSMYSVAPDLGDAPLWMVPHALGYFADEGLNVGVEYAWGSSGALQLLAAGKGQFATSTPTQVMLATHQGLKIKSVFEHNRTYGSALVVPTTAGIKTLEELRAYLKGSNIGVASMASGRIPYARAWIRELGLKEDEDVKLVAVGVGPQAAAALKSKAMWNEVQDNDRKAGLISATRPVEDYFTSRLEAQANAFDAEAVRRQAKSFTDAMSRYTSP